ncbi:MAG TPA: tRNA adenosine(34) deaminase TadA [Coxiellaceae bacterium]|nr:tRNA adenosine(34) deaminase TadA [Coxiellaceae bacterium]
MSYWGDTDIQWMQQALRLAAAAEAVGEVPVGAVLIKENTVIGEGYNAPISTHDPTAHAEIRALRAGAAHLGNYRLPGTTLYVTLEPCAMCLGALIHARIERLIFGAYDPKAGAVISAFSLLEKPLNHTLQWTGGILEKPCGDKLKTFFQARRHNTHEGCTEQKI